MGGGGSRAASLAPSDSGLYGSGLSAQDSEEEDDGLLGSVSSSESEHGGRRRARGSGKGSDSDSDSDDLAGLEDSDEEQTWLQCDQCGKWRNVSDRCLREFKVGGCLWGSQASRQAGGLRAVLLDGAFLSLRPDLLRGCVWWAQGLLAVPVPVSSC